MLNVYLDLLVLLVNEDLELFWKFLHNLFWIWDLKALWSMIYTSANNKSNS